MGIRVVAGWVQRRPHAAMALALLLLRVAAAYPGPYPPGGSCNINGR
jgi:hypothetical protein